MTNNKEQKVCETCDGTGEVRVQEQVYPGEPHTADVGTAPCPDCNCPNADDYDESQDDR